MTMLKKHRSREKYMPFNGREKLFNALGILFIAASFTSMIVILIYLIWIGLYGSVTLLESNVWLLCLDFSLLILAMISGIAHVIMWVTKK